MDQIQRLMYEPSLFTISLFLLSLLLIILTKKTLSQNPRNLPPSPPKLPLIGNLHQLGSLPHRSLQSLSLKHGPLLLLHLGQIPTLIACSPDTASDFLKTHDQNFATRPPFKAAEILCFNFQDLVFAPYGEHWRNLRKLCSIHIFSQKMAKSYQNMREEEIDYMIEKVKEESLLQGSVDMSKRLYFFANDMICRVVSGKFFRQEGRNDLFREIIEENRVLLGGFSFGDYFPILGWMDGLIGISKRAKKNLERWDLVLDQVLREHRERKKEEGQEDFVDLLISLQGSKEIGFELSDFLIKALLSDMFAAGTETSYIVLEWAMAELMRNPQIMRKLQEETRDNNISSPCRILKTEQLNRMNYLRAVVKETMRLHPPVPLLIPRECMEDCHVRGYSIAKGTRLLINAWAINRDPLFWDAPDEFKPERFIGSEVDYKGNDFQFIPFGAGRRICPGMQFGTATVELALANLVSRFDWELPDGLTADELDMSEATGLTTPRKHSLVLVAKPCM